MRKQRITVTAGAILTAVAVGAAAVGLALWVSTPSARHAGAAGGVSVYQCFNAAGTVEKANGGLAPQRCAHASDPQIVTAGSQYVPPPPATTTTKATSTTTAAAPSTTSAPATTTTVVTSGAVWSPTTSHSIAWDWVISKVPTAHAGLDVIDTDGFDNTAANVTAWHTFGTVAICYLDLGTYEPTRPDLKLIPAKDVGQSLGGEFGDESWLDIRDVAGLTPLVQSRVAMCKTKGFDAVEPDDIDGYTNDSGFPLTAGDQLAYNRMIAATVHAAGMSVGLKNDTDQAAQLEPSFDWALDEQCNQYGECGSLKPFTAANKAVFNAEYQGNTSTFCPADAAAKINGAKFVTALNGTGHTACPAW